MGALNLWSMVQDDAQIMIHMYVSIDMEMKPRRRSVRWVSYLKLSWQIIRPAVEVGVVRNEVEIIGPIRLLTSQASVDK